MFTVPKDEPPSLRIPTLGVRQTKIDKKEESKDKFIVLDDHSSVSSTNSRRRN